jgi:hypothetical protein
MILDKRNIPVTIYEVELPNGSTLPLTATIGVTIGMSADLYRTVTLLHNEVAIANQAEHILELVEKAIIEARISE